MKFHVGPIPEDTSFQPQTEGWSALKEPGPWQLQFLTVPIATLTAALLILGFTLAFPRVYPTSFRSFTFSIWQGVLLIILLIPVHELSHAVCTPHLGRSANTLIGVWPQKMLFYVYYAGGMARNRFVALLLAPFVVLSILPLFIIIMQGNHPIDSAAFIFLSVLSVMNGVASSGDMLEAALILFQVPRRAMIRKLGWKSYWKLPEPSYAAEKRFGSVEEKEQP